MKCYRKVSLIERVKTGRPGEETVANVLRAVANVCRAAGIDTSSPISAITRQKLELALGAYMARGLKRLSAWSYVCQLRAMVARWCRPYYEDAGWDVSPIELPVFRAPPPRYVRPGAELLARVKAWYRSLQGERWFAATMMLEFAMRNGDVLRLREENIVSRSAPEARTGCEEPGVLHYLSYTPHKTELTSARRVFWPIHETIWRRIESYGGLAGLEVTKETFGELNRELRGLGFRGSKASYELRKICIDHIYQQYGAEMAVSISGDDIKTLTRYYADPAQPNLGVVRVIDLL